MRLYNICYSVNKLIIFKITSDAFSMLSNGTYSYFPWKLWPPANIFGHGNPMKLRFAPSVPPRIGCTFGLMPAISIALIAF